MRVVELEFREGVFHLAHGLQDALGMAVGGIQHDYIHLGPYQCLGPFHHVRAHADGRAHQQPAHAVLCGIGILPYLFDILDGDEALEAAVLIDDQEFFDTVFVQERLGMRLIYAYRCGHQILAGHHVVDPEFRV